jgi:hypothetical protein
MQRKSQIDWLVTRMSQMDLEMPTSVRSFLQQQRDWRVLVLCLPSLLGFLLIILVVRLYPNEATLPAGIAIPVSIWALFFFTNREHSGDCHSIGGNQKSEATTQHFSHRQTARLGHDFSEPCIESDFSCLRNVWHMIVARFSLERAAHLAGQRLN